MVDGIHGNFGILSNVESATYGYAEVLSGSNPTLTARIEPVQSGHIGNRMFLRHR